MLALGLLPRGALADDLPTVTFVPPAQTGTDTLFDRQLPVSKSFVLRYPMEKDTEAATAILDVWPAAEGIKGLSDSDSSCGSPQPGAKQTYRLGMTLGGSADGKYLEAQIPPLQVGQRFCFQVTVTRSLSTTEYQGIAKVAAKKLVDQVLSGGECYGNQSQGAFEAALRDTLREQSVPVHDVTGPAQLAQSAYLANESRECAALATAKAKEISEAQIEEARQRVSGLLAHLASLPPLPAFDSPLVRVKEGDVERVVPASQLMTPGSTDKTLTDAAIQLRSRKGAGAAWDQNLDAWSDALMELAAAAPDKKASLITDIRGRFGRALRPPPNAELWNGSAFVSVASFQRSPNLEAVVLAAQTVRFSPAADALRKRWVDLLDQIVAAQQQATLVQQEFVKRREVTATNRGSLQTLLANAFKADDVRKHLFLELSAIKTTPVAGSEETPNKGNYASPDFGVLLALPGFDTWVLPYVGLNLYFTTVDRTIAPVRLTGTFSEKFLQRFSVTLGCTLSTPSSPGVTISGPVLTRTPVIAAGLRLTQYTRVVGGVLLYKLTDPNPASANENLRVTGFVGASLDADLITLLTDKL